MRTKVRVFVWRDWKATHGIQGDCPEGGPYKFWCGKSVDWPNMPKGVQTLDMQKVTCKICRQAMGI